MTKVLTTRDLRCPVNGKSSYVDQATADKHSDIIMRQRGYDGKMPRRSYHCNSCGWWHLTSR